MEANLWWGYKHTSGTLQAKRYIDRRDTQEAEESPFVEEVFYPFYAKDREDALNQIKELIKSSDYRDLDWGDMSF